jgi:MYXO-CTERM domain-containing protein
VVALLVLAQQTTTTEVRRIVGDPLPEWVVIGAGLALLAVILVAGFLVRRRSRAAA